MVRMERMNAIGRRVLVVEDDPEIGDSLVDALRAAGHEVVWAKNGKDALRRADDDWGLVVLDLNLPELSGESFLANLRQRPDYPAVLVVSARQQLDDKLTLFSMGCDDYLTKPFHREEFMARAEALLRRPPRLRAAEVSGDALALDPIRYQASAEGQAVTLTPKEFAFLRELVEAGGRVVTRKELLEKVWGLTAEPSANYIGIHLFNLRKKLATIQRDRWIRTMKFSGYALRRPEAP